MRQESKEIIDVKVDELKQLVGQYEKDLRTIASAPYPLTEIRINLKEQRVFVVWEDYSDEEAAVKSLITEAVNVKNQLANTTDDVQKAILLYQMGEIDKQYKSLTGFSISEVV